MRRFLASAIAVLAIAPASAYGAGATFERNLNVGGKVELNVATGSGNIHLTHGPGNQVHIIGHVHSSWGANEGRVQQIAANPPIEQTGNIVRIGARHEDMHNISIDYDIEAPADCWLDAASGSGNVTDDGTGQNAKLSTGSGNIHATGLHGSFKVQTSSGNIYADQTGDGDARAETGSGSIELRNLHGGVIAETGSGNIKVAGTPSAGWRLHTGSGSVEIWTGNAGFTLDAGSGSGSVHCDRDITSHGVSGHHHVNGTVGGGGPQVKIDTGSGEIRVH